MVNVAWVKIFCQQATSIVCFRGFVLSVADAGQQYGESYHLHEEDPMHEEKVERNDGAECK